MSHLEPEALWAEACDLTSPEEHAALAPHLEDCPACQDRFAEYSAERQLLEEATASRPSRRMPWFFVAAAVVLFAATSAVIVRSGGGILDRSPAAQEGDAVMTLSGTLKAFRDVEIWSRVQAHVEELPVDRGTQVKKGQLLARLKSPDLEAKLEEVRAQLAQDQAPIERLRGLVKAGLAQALDLQTAEKKVDVDLVRIKTCETQLAYLRITAPFDGVIAERTVSEGSLVGPAVGDASKPMLRLQEVGRLRLVAEIPEQNLAAAVQADGQPVKFTVESVPGQIFVGKIARSSGSIDPKSRTLEIELDIDNSSGKLLPGMSARVLWPIRR